MCDEDLNTLLTALYVLVDDHVVPHRRPVAIEALIDRVWGDTPPVGARDVLYSHLSRIRQLLMKATSLTGTVGRGRQECAECRRGPGCRVDRGVKSVAWPTTGGISGDWANHVRDDWLLRRLDAVG
jgi:hypothetical protein